jgi:hypothetical protein
MRDADPANMAGTEAAGRPFHPEPDQELWMTERKDEEQDKPLSSEALKRDEWRGDSASGSAEERERDTADEGNRDVPDPLARTVLPPD